MLREQEFDLVLTDLMMPEMDGIALLRAAQEIDVNLVGVVMTGHGAIDTAIRGHESRRPRLHSQTLQAERHIAGARARPPPCGDCAWPTRAAAARERAHRGTETANKSSKPFPIGYPTTCGRPCALLLVFQKF